MNPVVHFEMAAKDKSRMRKFYETAFGWQTEQLGKEMGEYVVVTTIEPDEKTGLPGAINYWAGKRMRSLRLTGHTLKVIRLPTN